jgi:hypothetical protein
MVLLVATWPASGRATERGLIGAFLEVTGFDVALDSIALSAADAPLILGIDSGAFGSEWTRATRDVFDTGDMREMAMSILENTLDEDALRHAVDFYASDLGQRLVAAENASHMMDDDAARQDQGAAALAAGGEARQALLDRLNQAVDASGSGVRALQEIQFRFLLAAAAAGVVELRADPDELRAMMKRDEPQLARALRQSALINAAFTYRDFSDADLEAYATALEEPQMQLVYQLLNAVQHEITANRFEALAVRMAQLRPGEEL